MNCPYCESRDTKVLDSRESKDGDEIKRRRQCEKCENKFSTIEKLIKLDLEVEKNNKEIETFNLSKLKKSILKACDKRPITLEQIDKTTESILVDLKKINLSPIPTSKIGTIVLKNLKKLDEIAYLHFAIVHKKYESIKEILKNFDKVKYK